MIRLYASCPLLITITIATISTSTLLRSTIVLCFSASSFYCTISTFEMVQRLMSDLERNKTSSPDLSPEWCFSRHTDAFLSSKSA